MQTISYAANPLDGFIMDTDSKKEPIEVVEKTISIVFAQFKVFKKENARHIIWSTVLEYKNLGFTIQRSQDSKEWEDIGFIEGQIKSFDYVDYRFIDVQFMKGFVYYRLKQYNYDRSFSYSKIAEVKLGIPTKNTNQTISDAVKTVNTGLFL